MYVIKHRLCFLSEIVCRLFFLLQNKCRLCFLSSSDERDDVSKLVATVDSSSDGWMTSPRTLLLGGTVATDVFYLSLLNYHYNDNLIATDRLSLTTVTYDLLLQCM
jgi:hypothetical protein